jgi:hypothetical protein
MWGRHRLSSAEPCLLWLIMTASWIPPLLLTLPQGGKKLLVSKLSYDPPPTLLQLVKGNSGERVVWFDSRLRTEGHAVRECVVFKIMSATQLYCVQKCMDILT